MPCRQCGKLETPAGKERISPYHERVGSIANKRSEGSLDLATFARLNNVDLQADGGRCRGHIPSYRLRLRNAWIDKQADTHGSGNQFMQRPGLLSPQLGDEKIDPSRIASWSIETCDKPGLDWVFADAEDNGDRRGCGLGRDRRNISKCGDHGDLAADQIIELEILLAPQGIMRQLVGL